MLTRLNDTIARSFLVLAAILAFLLCFLVVGDVIGRVVFNAPIKGTPEIVATSIVIICFLQAGHAIRSGGMLNVDALLKRLSPSGQAWGVAVGAVLGAAFFAFMCWSSVPAAVQGWVSNEFEGEGAMHVPTWPTRFVLVLGCGLAATSYLLMAAENVRSAWAGQGPVGAGASH